MACKYKAPNGELSTLFDDTYNMYGRPVAVKVWSTVNSEQFKNWYSTGVLNSKNEPVLNSSNEFVNGNNEKVHITDLTSVPINSISLEDTATQIENLSSIFKSQGLDIEVNLSADLDNIGSVITINDKTKVSFNPRLIQKDSIFHEFGHLYIDMLGDSHKTIKRGIEQVRNTELWDKVARLYPELSDDKLAKEVLTTAIGIKAASLYDERVRMRDGSILDKIKGFKSWFSAFISNIAFKLGITNNAAQKLAYDLSSFNLSYTLTGKPVTYIQKQKKSLDIKKLIKESNRLSLTDDESHYMIDGDKDRLLQRSTTAIESVKGKFDRESALRNVAKSKKPEYLGLETEEDVAKNWADKREEGTALHLINEHYIDRINAGDTREDAIKYVYDNLHTPKEGLDDTGVRFYSGIKKEDVETYINDIADFLDSLYAKGYKLYPEIKVFDEEMGVAGTIDLIVEKPNGELMIYDFKTKEVGKFKKFYTINSYNPTFSGISSDIKRTKANEYSLQLSTYKMILERQGYKVTKLAIIPFEGEIVKKDDEYHYINVKLYSDNTTKTDPDKVLPINDLSKQLENVYSIKEDIEQIIHKVDSSDKNLDEKLEDLSELRSTRKWLDTLIVNIKKSISRLRTTDVEVAINYENKIKKLVDTLSVEEEMVALTSYTEYITRGLTSLYSKFFDKFELVTNADGTTSRKYVKGYDSYTWKDISKLEKTSPKEYAAFLAFMINADMFLEQVVTIQKLPYTDARQSNLVIKMLKSNESNISDLKIKINRLNRELDMRYNELSSNPLTGGRGVIENTKEFFSAQVDESFMQRNFDALADTHNGYMANVMRMVDYKNRYMEDEIRDYTENWVTKLEELKKSGGNIDKIIDKLKAKLVTEIDIEAYKNNLNDLYADLDSKYKGKRSRAWGAELNSWLDRNVIQLSAKEIKKLIASKKKELGKSEYKKWFLKQLYEVKGQHYYNRTGAFFKPNPTIYTSQLYKNLNEVEKEFLKYTTKLFTELTGHVTSSILKEGYLPAIPLASNKSVTSQVIASLGWRESGGYNHEKGVIVNELGELVYFLPFKFNNMLAKAKYIKTDELASEAVRTSNILNNKNESKRVREAHAAAVNQDLSATMKIYIREALKHKHKKSMEFELQRVRKSFIANHKIKVTKGGKSVIDKFKKMGNLENNTVEKSTIGSNTLARYEDWLKMVFYEQFENEEGTLQKVARVLQNYTSFKGMALNPLSALNNQTYGSLMLEIEAASGQFFSRKDWRAARVEYGKGITSYFNDKEDSPSTKQSAFIEYFNIMMDYKEQALGNEEVNLANRNLRRASWVASKAFALEHLSEHNLQNRALIAMAFSHKLVDGQLVSFQDYIRGKLKTYTVKTRPTDEGVTIEEAKIIIAENKELRIKLEEKFNSNKSFYELISFENGKLVFDESISKEEVAEFERRVLGVNHMLHGIYNKEDAGAIQAYALGRLAIQFRKWMRPGWTKRFGTRFGQEYWNERRSVNENGMYIVTAKFLATPLLRNIEEFKNLRSEEAKEHDIEPISIPFLIKNIVKDYSNFFINIKVHWHTLNDMEKSAVIRTFSEYVALCMAIGAGYLLKFLKEDEEEPPYALLLAMYQLDRTATELTTFIPLAIAPGDIFNSSGGSPIYVGGGWFNEAKKLIKSPTATFSTIDAIVRLGKNLITYPFVEAESMVYRGGVYRGENKVEVQVKKLIPFWNQYEKIKHLPQNYHYYKLF